jgi:5-methylcytosine-specific restriction endonuclease McrA
MNFPKPKRIRLNREDYREQREALFERQGYRCAICGRIRPLTRDHIVKRSQLGGDEWANAQGLCVECHRDKDEYRGGRHGNRSDSLVGSNRRSR